MVNVTPLVTVDPRGGFLVADWKEAQLRRYSPNGQLVFSTGRKGNGPDEYQNPTRFLRLANGELMAADYRGKLVRYDRAAERVRDTYTLPLDRVEDLIALDDDRALIAGVGEDGKLVHVWNAARNQIEASFFTPAEHVTNTMAAAFMNFVQIARRADTVAVVFSISDSIFFYTLQGQHIRTIPLPSPSFRVIGPETPDAVRLDATARRDWMGTFDLTSHINWLGDGTLVVMWKRLDPAEALAPSWHAVHLTPGGRLLSETATPQFLAFDPRTDSLYFVAPSAEVPNQWIAAYLQ